MNFILFYIYIYKKLKIYKLFINLAVNQLEY